MKIRSLSSFLGACALGWCLASTPAKAHAQADDTLQRPADLLVFGGYGYTRPDYGQGHNNGLVFGVDYDRSFGWRVIPGLEIRGNVNSGSNTTEHSYMAGPRFHINAKRRFHPYADFLAGLGQIHYPEYSTTVHDTGFVYSLGGGVDVDVVHNVMFKADFQSESWNMGPNSYTKPQGGNFTISPPTVTLGVTYRIPFRKWVDSRHNH